MPEKAAYLEVVVGKCPACGNLIIEPSWFALQLESDIQCANCRNVFNMKKHLTDKILLKFELDEKGKIKSVTTG